jgi:hypothetical protein
MAGSEACIWVSVEPSQQPQPVIDGVLAGRQFQHAAHQFHGRTGPAERTRHERQRRFAAPVALKQAGQDRTGGRGLLAAEIVERNILRALETALRIPLSFTVANIVDGRRGHRAAAIPWQPRNC